MRHRKHEPSPEEAVDQGREPRSARSFGRHGGRRGGRMFDYGELRLLILAMIADQPRHGYELIKAIEERYAGSYSPSPGVIYPTLSWLDDMGYAAMATEDGSRKRYSITPEGEAFLAANRKAADELLTRGSEGCGDGPPTPVIRAMHNLKTALRLRLTAGPMDKETVQRIAAALDTAAKTVEES